MAKPACAPQKLNLEKSRENLAETLTTIYQENNTLLPNQETLLKKLYASYEKMRIEMTKGRCSYLSGVNLEEAFTDWNSGKDKKLEWRIDDHPYARLEMAVESYFHDKELAGYFAQKEPEMLSRFHGFGMLGAYLIIPLFNFYLYSSSPSARIKDLGKALLCYVALFPIITPLGFAAATCYALLPRFARNSIVKLIERRGNEKACNEFHFNQKDRFNAIDKEMKQLLITMSGE